MARADDTELIDAFEEFYRSYYRNEIGELAQKYPTEQKSLYIDWRDLYQFDPHLADDFRSKPEQIRQYAEEALRLYDLPVDVSLGQAHVRVRGLPERTDIREIRADHRGMLIAIQGIVRKATDVRPKIVTSAFECQRCGTLTRIPQEGGDFQEPHECQGCERQGPFRINYDQSEFIDAQKLRIQESPEGLRGGETPQNVDVNIEDDITGRVTAGDHVEVTGILKLDQQGNEREKSPMFDFYMNGMTVEIEDEQFEEMDITDEDKKQIIELSNEPDIYEKMEKSIAPSIYGYEKEKRAMIFQLFSGVTKHLPDGSRTRGDLHMLLIGDPGTGKCIKGDNRIRLSDGSRVEIGAFVEENLDDPVAVDDGYYGEVDVELPTMNADGTVGVGKATRVWKREAPEKMYRIRTSTGRELEATPSHPLFVPHGGTFRPKKAEDLVEGEFIATPADVPVSTRNSLNVGHERQHVISDGGQIHWDRIDEIEITEPDYDWVYDLEVEGTHNYISEGIVSHNSQLLQYIREIAPRSVYTSGKGSSSAGLCVTGDTLIHTEEGYIPIRTLAEREHPTPVDTDTAAPFEECLCTFDRESGDIVEKESSHVWRMPEKECLRIETEYGKQLEASQNTPLLVCGKEGIEWKPLSQIETGDHVAVPKYDTVSRTSPPVETYTEYTNEKLKPTDESVSFLRNELCEEFGTLRDAANELDLSEDFIYDSLANRHLPQEKLDRILDAIDPNRDDIDIARAMLRHGSSVAIPERFDSDLLYLVGLVFGDGDIMVSRRGDNRGCVRISNSDRGLLEEAARIIENTFDYSVSIEHQDERVPCIRIHSATIARLFENLGMVTPKETLELDHRLTTAENTDAFLQGLFDADGAVCERNDGGSSIQLSTISPRLARQVQLMLASYGVSARSRKRDRRGKSELQCGYEIHSQSVQTHLTIYGADIATFAENIGFRSGRKQRALERLIERSNLRGASLPIGETLARTDGAGGKFYNNVTDGDNPSRKRAHDILTEVDLGEQEGTVEEVVESALLWESVVSVERTGTKEVFDLTVPGTHNFIGNGLVTHNTAAAVRDDFGDGQQWSLEAGALVLADQGIAAVDELDKMRCVTGDTLVHTADGVCPIRELAFDAPDDDVEYHENGRTYRNVDLAVWTMTEEGKLTTRSVTAIHEYEAPETLHEVRLESGEHLTTTADHPFFVLEDGIRVEKAANELEPDDWVYVPDTLPQPVSDGGATTMVDNSAPGMSGITSTHGAVMGYLVGDGNVYSDSEQGHGIRFTNKEETLRADFERACREVFDKEPVRPPSDQRADGVETVHLHGKSVVDELLDAGVNLEIYEGKRIPEAVARGATDVKSSFLRALADSEGSVDDRKITITSSSYELLAGAKMLLSEFGVTCQVQTVNRDERRDIYVLAITSSDSLLAFRRYIGFTLERKQEALDSVCERVSGNRTILDVVPETGDLFREARTSLRLHQSECGLSDATYCSFENGDANFSFPKARQVLKCFEERRRQAIEDRRQITSSASWDTIGRLKDSYHISQRELTAGTAYSQQQVSNRWSDDELLRQTLAERLTDILDDVAATDLSDICDLVRGDVKWRRVEQAEPTDPTVVDGRIQLLQRQLASLLDVDVSEAEARARTVLDEQPTTSSLSAIQYEMERHNISQRSVADQLSVNQSTVSRWLNSIVECDSFDAVQGTVRSIIETRREEIGELLKELRQRRKPSVYDLTVEGTHNFVANSMIVHNSEDQSAMHEALEQQSISVSKAGINATLKSRCSLLGAANPTYGRFDQYEPIGEQIDLDPPLISRFDLIFTVTDNPNEEKDAELAEHIIKTNYAGELNTHREQMQNSDYTVEEVERVTEDVSPEIDAELLRKYIAYAKRNCYPTMTEEAKSQIREFYVNLRSTGSDEDAPVPVTARKLEALVRLAEASARVRLSDTVEMEDAVRGTEIARYCLEEIGMDPETGEFDADVVETGTTKSQRDRIKNIKHLIADIEAEYDEGAPFDVVVERAEEVGIDLTKTEHEIEKLKQKGEVYEPQTGYLRTT